MDDDGGMLLNFAPVSNGGTGRPGVPGGRPAKRKAVHDVASHLKGSWKRRRIAARKIVSLDKKKTKAALEEQQSTPAGTSGAEARLEAAATSRRQQAFSPERTEDGSAERGVQNGRAPKKGSWGGTATEGGQRSGPISPPGEAKAAPRQWVTSLFSANPTVELPPAAEKSFEDVKEASPEPVFDSSTFSGLGMDRFLATHLAGQLHMKRPTSIQAASIPHLIGARKSSDAIIQAQTGSGKTLTYLLPILNCLLSIDDRGASRRSGCFAIILAPTRELARQIYGVLESLLNFSSKSTRKDGDSDGSDSDSDEDSSDSDEDVPTERRPRWIVPGLVVGGDSKKSEKARIRKGINILVSTPGRLLDHLQNTKALNVSKVRWLVLDEADRLMDLGFEETIKEILGCLKREGRACNFTESWQEVMPERRVTWLCSATMKDHGGMERLQNMSVENPLVVVDKSIGEADGDDRSGDSESSSEDGSSGKAAAADLAATEEELQHSRISVPNQLRQTYLVVPAKQRLVVLISLLKTEAAGSGAKVIVFVSCQDSVDFLFDLFGKLKPESSKGASTDQETRGKKAKALDHAADAPDLLGLAAEEPAVGVGKGKGQKDKDPISVDAELFSGTPVFRLHGNMPQHLRTQTFQQFTRCERGILLCTDVAARGLDLPNVSAIVQYDPPSDFKDYVHRAGRTARLGKAGRAVILLLPSEIEYVDLLSKEGFSLHGEKTDLVLENLAKAGRTGAAKWKKVAREEMERKATDLQMSAERWVLSDPKNTDLARRAFTSHVRAYATHSASEKHIFHLRKLHLGHLAKSFGLRDAPSVAGSVPGVGKGSGKKDGHAKAKAAAMHRGAEGQQKRRQQMNLEFGDGGIASGKLSRGPTVKKKRR
ncbi:P-loop containing nucleoside triphosphate hydrolase protein [Hyaloraphidium curvatum]|nr:P-loop containing nucleoside triphosphate hydrolase protein [Hyaloraphidium curvatum]